MRRLSPVLALVLTVPAALAGCGGSTPREPKGSAGKASPAPAPAPGPAAPGAGGKGLSEVVALAYGPYVAAAGAKAGAQLSFESGYVDVRRQKNGDTVDIFDYRWKTAAVIAARDHIPAAPAEGCADVSSAGVTAAGEAGVTVQLSGAVTATPERAADGAFRFDDRTGATTFDVSRTLTAAVAGGAAGSVSLASPAPPTPGAIRLAGAFDVNLSVNTSLKDLNGALAAATTELLVADVGTAEGYDLVVVVFYGGSAARTKALRCILRPEGSVSIAPATFKDLLPLRGLVGFFAKVELEATASGAVWRSAIVGQGAEDVLVP